MEHPIEVQNRLLIDLINKAKNTEWGNKYQYESIIYPYQFSERVPLQDYESLKPYITRMMSGEKDILWGGRIEWFSKSSGTTSDKSKYIPVSAENLKECHIRGSWDTMTFFYDQRKDAKQFECKNLLMGGSFKPYSRNEMTKIGDVSAIMIHNMPRVAYPFITPGFEVALLDDFEEKIVKMAEIVSKEKDLVTIGGVPTWTIVLFKKILELTGKDNMLEVWPNLQAYIHGGVSFLPYREQFRKYLPSDSISYIEVYNASEGFFAAMNDIRSDDMLLLLDNGVYYEFVPMAEWKGRKSKAIPLEEVEVGKNYAVVISTNSGLWRYIIGDTVEFTAVKPYKIKITGRTKQFINAFGEEVMVHNTDKAIAITCNQTGAVVSEYTAAPIFLNGSGKGGHEWLIEFEKQPGSVHKFSALLDSNLQKLNSDYEAKRYRDLALMQLIMHPVPSGTFYNWLKAKKKYGGQHKVPRLSNNRDYLEEILKFAK